MVSLQCNGVPSAAALTDFVGALHGGWLGWLHLRRRERVGRAGSVLFVLSTVSRLVPGCFSAAILGCPEDGAAARLCHLIGCKQVTDICQEPSTSR